MTPGTKAKTSAAQQLNNLGSYRERKRPAECANGTQILLCNNLQPAKLFGLRARGS
jgi:hypothetical protein